MTDEIQFDRAHLPDHSAWEFVHAEPGTAIWARHVNLDEFAAAHNLNDEDRAAYRATGADPSYQIELNKNDDGDYGVTLSRSTGPDSSGVLTPDCRNTIDPSHALTHIQKLLKQYA